MTDHAALDLLSDVLIHHGARLCSRCREAGCCVADRLISRPHAGGNVDTMRPDNGDAGAQCPD